MRPSPARAQAPEPGAWLPILDLVTPGPAGAATAHDSELHELEEWLRLPAVDPATTPPAGVPVLRPARAPRGAPRPEGARTVAFVLPAPARRSVAAPRPARGAQPGGPPHPDRTPGHRVARRRERVLRGLLAGTLVGLAAAALPSLLSARPPERVTLSLDGHRYARTTRAATVAAFLVAEGVRLAPGDRVIPDASTRLTDGLAIRLLHPFAVHVEVDGAWRTVRTTRHTASRLRRELGLPVGTEILSAPSRLGPGARVVFAVPHRVTLSVDGRTSSFRSTARTVRQVLADERVAVHDGDRVVPGLGTAVTDGLQIAVTDAAAYPASGASSGGTLTGAPATAIAPPAAAAAVVAARREGGYATWYATLGVPGTCAHLALEMGTIVHVTRVDTGATVTCRVADRGPRPGTGNVIDLAPDVFRRLGSLYGDGRIEVVLSW